MLNMTASDAPQTQNALHARSIMAAAARQDLLARALAPTIYCPESRVEECLAESKRGMSS